MLQRDPLLEAFRNLQRAGLPTPRVPTSAPHPSPAIFGSLFSSKPPALAGLASSMTPERGHPCQSLGIPSRSTAPQLLWLCIITHCPRLYVRGASQQLELRRQRQAAVGSNTSGAIRVTQSNHFLGDQHFLKQINRLLPHTS